LRADYYPGYRKQGCVGGNCDCCEGEHVDIDSTTGKGWQVHLTADMLAELEREVQADPARYLQLPAEAERMDNRI